MASPAAQPYTVTVPEVEECILDAIEQGCQSASMAQSGADYREWALGVLALAQALVGTKGGLGLPPTAPATPFDGVNQTDQGGQGAVDQASAAVPPQ